MELTFQPMVKTQIYLCRKKEREDGSGDYNHTWNCGSCSDSLFLNQNEEKKRNSQKRGSQTSPFFK